MITAKIGKLIPYLNYILDKDVVMQNARQSCTTVKEVLNKYPIDTTNNTGSFLNGLTEDELKTTNIKDRISIITWGRKVVSKHHHSDTGEAKIDVINHQIKVFIDSLFPL